MAELERIKALGLRGIKLHPDYQDIFPDEERMFPLYEKMAELGLPVVLHAGWDPVSPDMTRCTPARIRRVIDRVPNLTLIAAHMGGMRMADEVMEQLAGRNLYFDTSMSYVYLDPERFNELIRAHGAERILFGSDCPWSISGRQIAMLHETGLSAGELSMILHGNAERLLGRAGAMQGGAGMLHMRSRTGDWAAGALWRSTCRPFRMRQATKAAADRV
jgi:predicted TIM-barrel fold metal-dependent hydrolase